MGTALEYPRGSEWRKWDLHTHTPASILENSFPRLNGGAPDWEAYVQALEATDLAVLGVTDYFTIDGYKKLKEFKNAGRLRNVSCLLPNIEFRLNTIISSRHDGANPRRLNYHVIFSDEVPVEEIGENFLHDITFMYEGDPQHSLGTMKLKPSNIAALGARLKAEHPPFADETDLVVGAKNIVVELSEIVRALQHPRFRGKYVRVAAEELLNTIPWNGQDHHTRKSVVQASDMMFSPSTKTRNWCLGLEPYDEGPAAFVKEFKSLKPCVHGSDAHSLERINKPCSKRSDPSHNCETQSSNCDMRFLWVKADPTFEGLRQLTYEPDERVIIQAVDPTPMRGGYTLDEFHVEAADISAELRLAGDGRTLGHGLVAVCGGKGAGKTAYVDLLANCFVDRAATNDPNSFVRRILAPPSFGAALSTTIRFRNGETFKKEISDGTVFDKSDVVYIAQGQLEDYISDTARLEQFVRGLIFGSPAVKNSVLRFEYEEVGKEIKNLVEDVRAASKEIVALEESTGDDRLQALRTTETKSNATVSDMQAQVAELQERLGPEKAAQAEAQQARIVELKTRRSTIEQLVDTLASALKFADKDLPAFNLLVEKANTLIEASGLQGRLPTLVAPVRSELQRLLEEAKPLIAATVRETEAAQKMLDGYAADVRQHAGLLERRAHAEESAKTARAAIAALEAGRQQLTESRLRRQALLTSMLNATLDERERYSAMIDAFASSKAVVLSDLDFSPEIFFDRSRLVRDIAAVTDNRTARISEDGGDIAALLDLYEQVAQGDRGEVDNLASEILARCGVLAGMLKPVTGTVKDLYAVLFANFLEVRPAVKYKRVGLQKLSMGQKATVLIKIYLAEGDQPIIIDSHDDHLDNAYIMDELISAIRDARRYRQVILVSNNGNVVVNSDADQVIIASHEDGVVRYVSGSLENPSIRDTALRVLEGGEDAFRRRQQKYRLGR